MIFISPIMERRMFLAMSTRTCIGTFQCRQVVPQCMAPPSDFIIGSGSMRTVVVRKSKSGILLSLADLINRLQLKDITSWHLRDITLHGIGRPFGMNFDEFEAATRTNTDGFEVSPHEFQAFLESDLHVIDGVIEALSSYDPKACVMRIECDDATQWELTTDLQELGTILDELDS